MIGTLNSCMDNSQSPCKATVAPNDYLTGNRRLATLMVSFLSASWYESRLHLADFKTLVPPLLMMLFTTRRP